jgi:hypothetical protein
VKPKETVLKADWLDIVLGWIVDWRFLYGSKISLQFLDWCYRFLETTDFFLGLVLLALNMCYFSDQDPRIPQICSWVFLDFSVWVGVNLSFLNEYWQWVFVLPIFCNPLPLATPEVKLWTYRVSI